MRQKVNSSRFGGYRTADAAAKQNINNSANGNGAVDQSFRVENRRARPKIVKNAFDQGNKFFIQ